MFDHNAFLVTSGNSQVGELQKTLQRCGVEGAFVSSLDAIRDSSPSAGNAALLNQIATYKNLRAVSVFNPLASTSQWPSRGREECEKINIRLAPVYHGYTLEEPRLAEGLKKISPERVFITVQLRDPRNQRNRPIVPDLPVEGLVSLAHRFPEIDFIANGISGTAIQKIIKEWATCENLLMDCTLLDGADSLGDWGTYGREGKLLFGSGQPIHYPEAARLKFELWSLAPPLLLTKLQSFSDLNS